MKNEIQIKDFLESFNINNCTLLKNSNYFLKIYMCMLTIRLYLRLDLIRNVYRLIGFVISPDKK